MNRILLIAIAAVLAVIGVVGAISVQRPHESVPSAATTTTRPPVSRFAPIEGDFTVVAPVDGKGQPADMAPYRGKVLLVNLWATWCAPCRAEMPALDALQAKKGGADFEVVAINVDTGDDAKPRKFLEETGVKSLAYYRDPSLDSFNALREKGLALGLPVTVLADGEGCALLAMNGPANWAGADAAALIEAALSAKP